MAEIVATAVKIEHAPSGVPEVGRVDYDLWTLRVTLHFSDAPPAYVTFKDLSGIRILREGDLAEYWHPGRPDGWRWEVQSGGWSTLESQRTGFTTGHMSGVKEFLVVGLVDCISVLSSSAPEFSQIEP